MLRLFHRHFFCKYHRLFYNWFFNRAYSSFRLIRKPIEAVACYRFLRGIYYFFYIIFRTFAGAFSIQILERRKYIKIQIIIFQKTINNNAGETI